MLRTGLPVGAGTDATRVASYNPFVSLYWLVTGKTVGGLSMYDEDHRFDRMEALRLWTLGSSWLSTEQGSKGSIAPGQLADLAVLSADYFSVADEEIKTLESVLTMVGGKPVYATEEFAELAPRYHPCCRNGLRSRLMAAISNPRSHRLWRARPWSMPFAENIGVTTTN
jgi:cytosine/adenosine deaminase-related metal-dependent hydrolase